MKFAAICSTKLVFFRFFLTLYIMGKRKAASGVHPKGGFLYATELI